VLIEEFSRPMLSDDVETAQTVYMMDGLSFEDAGHQLIINATNEALADAGLTLSSPPAQKACAIFWWLKKHIRYVPTPGTSPLVDQTLIPPVTLLSMPDPEGDCPQFSMLAAAMLRVCCVPSQFKTIAADPAYPETYSHIYNLVQIGPRQFMPFDSSNGPHPGAEYARPGKTKVWPQIAQDKCKDQMNHSALIPTNRNRVLRSALRDGHLYQTLNGVNPANWDPWRSRRLADATDGLDTLPVYDSSGDPLAQDWLSSNPAAAGGSDPFQMTGPLAPAVPAGTVNTGGGTAGFFTSLAADATQLLTPFVRQATQQKPYYVTSPTGQAALYNPNTGTFASPAVGSISPATLLIIGLGIALFAFAGKR
jgi:hypothetical protein